VEAREEARVRAGESDQQNQLLWCSYELRGAGRAGITQAHSLSFSGCTIITRAVSRQSKRVCSLNNHEGVRCTRDMIG